MGVVNGATLGVSGFVQVRENRNSQGKSDNAFQSLESLGTKINKNKKINWLEDLWRTAAFVRGMGMSI